MGEFRKDEAIVIDLEECKGDTKKMTEVINKEIKIWMNLKNISINDDKRTAIISYEIDDSDRIKRLARAADLRLDVNIPCFEKVL